MSHSPTLMAIKSARAVIAGVGPEGSRYGRLVDIDEVVEGIEPKKKSQTATSDTNSEDVHGSFISKHLGIHSLATTHTTDAMVARARAGDGEWPDIAETDGRPIFNPDVEAMTAEALRLAFHDYTQDCPGHTPVSDSLAGHIHVSWSGDARMMYSLAEARRSAGCDKPGMSSVHILSACAGLIHALEHAQLLLQHPTAKDDEHAFVLITASNDMLPLAHTRGRCPAPENTDLNEWIFPTIFGEAAGAFVVGHANRAGGDWVIEDYAVAPVTTDWRVVLPDDQDAPHMVMRARDVGTTYRTHVPQVARQGLAALGLGEFSELHRLCLHEANPNMVISVAAGLNAPCETVHGMASDTGSLAVVSVFSLLGEALQSHRETSQAQDNIVCALIGETGGSVSAGHISLRYQRRPAVARVERMPHTKVKV
jgi:3-oxoacyl-[acyl-carrier-protein] synthase III